MDAESMRKKFEAYVRSQCPPDHPDPEGFLWYYRRDRGDDRDGNFKTDAGFPCIHIYRPVRWDVPGEPTIETSLVAHEFGHFRSWQGQTQEVRARLQKICHTDHDPTGQDKDEIMAEEEAAWRFAEIELRGQGFEAWTVFHECKRFALDHYLARFGRLPASAEKPSV